MERAPNNLPKVSFVGMVPATRLPPDRATVERLAELHSMVGRPLTPTEILFCLTPEGTA